jgi:hypothetical protein
MKRSARILIVFCFLAFVLSVLSFGDLIKTGSLQASNNGTDVTIRWSAYDETNVLRFEVLRSSGIDGNFVSIGNLEPKGISSYEFIDHSAFIHPTTMYQYRVAVYFNREAQPSLSPIVTVTHMASGVRRTWGSIKSLFR